MTEVTETKTKWTEFWGDEAPTEGWSKWGDSEDDGLEEIIRPVDWEVGDGPF
jgi:hypothetical protein